MLLLLLLFCFFGEIDRQIERERKKERDFLMELLEDEMKCDMKFREEYNFSLKKRGNNKKKMERGRGRALDFKFGCTSKRLGSVQRSVNAAKGQVRPSKMLASPSWTHTDAINRIDDVTSV